MAPPPSSRSLGSLTSAEVAQRLRDTSILCLPLGAIEQHGPHLPINTDGIVAEELTRRIVERWGDELDLWQLPTVPIGLSREHDWSPGTLSLTIQSFAGLFRDLARDIARQLPARNLAIVNGHGGNRGILDNLMHEWRGDVALNACIIHPFDLAKVDIDATSPDVHGGKAETSVMLALAPHLVRQDLITPAAKEPDRRRDRRADLRSRRELSLAHRRPAPDRERRDRRGACCFARARAVDHRQHRQGGALLFFGACWRASDICRSRRSRPTAAMGSRRGHRADKRREHAPIGVAEVGLRPRRSRRS